MKKINLNYHWLSSKIKQKKIAYALWVLFIILFSWYGYNCLSKKVCDVDIINKFVRHDVTIFMPNGVLVAEVADTKASRELGLSGREMLRPNEGMLFVFETPGRYGFWMKDMKFPLDIVWINQNGVVVFVEKNFTPESYLQNTPKVVTNNNDASYVLEMNNGRAEEYGLFLGAKVKIEE